MISDLAHKQNLDQRKVFEGLGYKFSIGHDGWTLFHNSDQVGDGRVYKEKGDQAYRTYLDHAILEAKKHRNTTAVVVITPQPPEPAPAVEPAPAGLTRMQQKTVEAAINLLKGVGALYQITAGGEEWSNVPAPPKEPRTSYKQYWAPVLEPFEGTGPFTTSVTLPEGPDWSGFVTSVRGYLHTRYGAGKYTTEAFAGERLIEILVSEAPFKEDV